MWRDSESDQESSFFNNVVREEIYDCVASCYEHSLPSLLTTVYILTECVVFLIGDYHVVITAKEEKEIGELIVSAELYCGIILLTRLKLNNQPIFLSIHLHKHYFLPFYNIL